jgi:hypothetical protein
VNLPAYSSFAAFRAHYRALKSARALADGERAQLAEIKVLLDAIGGEVRAALEAGAATGADARRRERAARKLRRELLARGILSG